MYLIVRYAQTFKLDDGHEPPAREAKDRNALKSRAPGIPSAASQARE
jgi:hypothetical protein